MNIQRHSFPAKNEGLDPRGQMMAMQEIEGNPLTPEDIAMFEMFDREGWSHERRRAYIVAEAMGLPLE